jgi:predicted ABC-type ATPase
MDVLSESGISELFMCVLQHLKCIEVRIEAAKTATSHRQKQTLNKAYNSAQNSIEQICTLINNKESINEIKTFLSRSDLLYLMLITEQLFKFPPESLEEILDVIEKYYNDNYGNK